MNLMLAVIFLSVALGVLSRRFGARQDLALALLAVAITALYFFFPARFM